jgi:hypothetical protein
MRCLGILIIAGFMLSGCETFPIPQYSLSQQNTMALKNTMMMGHVSSLAVGEFNAANPGQYELRCGMNKLIKMPNSTPYEKYIREALIDELKKADAYSLDQIEADRVITGQLDTFKLDSDTDSWVIKVTISFKSGQVFTVSETFENDGRSCERAAATLIPAVQELIHKIITHPVFQSRMGVSAG